MSKDDPAGKGLLQREIRRALRCRTKQQKIKLAREWQELYSPGVYLNLLAIARNKQAAHVVADYPTTNWNFEGKDE